MHTHLKLLIILWFSTFCYTGFSQSKFKIAVVGDTPYKAKDWKTLKTKFTQLEDSGYNLLVHVGDIKRGVLPCFKRRYKRVSKLLKHSTVPYLIIPGDNEYNDCYCRGPKRALKLWRKHTLNTEYDNQLNIKRSNVLPENFSFTKDSTLFIGIHNVSGRVHDTLEWKERTQHNIDWIEENIYIHDRLSTSIVIFSHASPKSNFGLYQALQKMSLKFSNQIYFIQGDIHSYSVKENWNKTKMTRFVVDNGNDISMFRTITILNELVSIK